MSVAVEIGARIALYRRAAGHTQESLGAQMGEGEGRNFRRTVDNVERGHSTPSADTLRRMHRAMPEMDIHFVITGEWADPGERIVA